jgi:hypothetical protein
MMEDEMDRACGMEKIINAYKIFIRKPEGVDHLYDPGIDGRITLK